MTVLRFTLIALLTLMLMACKVMIEPFSGLDCFDIAQYAEGKQYQMRFIGEVTVHKIYGDEEGIIVTEESKGSDHITCLANAFTSQGDQGIEMDLRVVSGERFFSLTYYGDSIRIGSAQKTQNYTIPDPGSYPRYQKRRPELEYLNEARRLSKVDLSVIETLKDEKVTTCTEAQELLTKSKELYLAADYVFSDKFWDEPDKVKRRLDAIEPFKLSMRNASSQIVKYC